jgi:tripartite-type tricarboxylate transporter receptor subunit TctC
MTLGAPKALAQHLSAELRHWNEIVKSAGIRLE